MVHVIALCLSSQVSMDNCLSDQAVTDNHIRKTYNCFKTDFRCGIQHAAAEMTCREKSSE